MLSLHSALSSEGDGRAAGRTIISTSSPVPTELPTTTTGQLRTAVMQRMGECRTEKGISLLDFHMDSGALHRAAKAVRVPQSIYSEVVRCVHTRSSDSEWSYHGSETF